MILIRKTKNRKYYRPGPEYGYYSVDQILDLYLDNPGQLKVHSVTGEDITNKTIISAICRKSHKSKELMTAIVRQYVYYNNKKERSRKAMRRQSEIITERIKENQTARQERKDKVNVEPEAPMYPDICVRVRNAVGETPEGTVLPRGI